MFRRIIAFILLSACLASISSAQKSIEGIITDASNGDVLIGVLVMIPKTDLQTSSDLNGYFKLEAPEESTHILVSYPGYINQKVKVITGERLNIKLVEDLFRTEIVSTGYGSLKQAEVASAISKIEPDQFNQGNINNTFEAIQGRVAGLSIYNRGGDLHRDPIIRLRGISTIGANAQPLIVIDGIVGASIHNLDPNDIAAINILKDGSAAAIYGSRGSSGVILITTKIGSKNSKVTTTYDAYVASSTVARKVNVMDRDDYLAAGGPDLGGETNWQDEVLRTGISTTHNLSIAGGSSKTAYRFSMNYRGIEGILKKSDYDQFNARGRIQHQALKDKLRIDFNMALTNRESNFSFEEVFQYAPIFHPSAPIRFNNGAFFQPILFDNYNPVAILDLNKNDGNRRILNFNIQTAYDFNDNFKGVINYSQQYIDNKQDEYYSSSSFFRGFYRGGLARRYVDTDNFTLLEAYAQYKKQHENLDLQIDAGYSYQEEDFQSIFLELGDFPSDDPGYDILETSADLLNGASSGLGIQSFTSPKEKIIAFFGRVNLNFNEVFTVGASLRREGSSKLGEDNRWGNFAALNLQMDLKHYLGMRKWDALKFRIGYGVTGSLPTESGLAQDLYAYSFTNGGTVSFVRAGNPDLKWEEKSELDIGFDFALKGYKLKGSIDYYSRKVDDFLREKRVETTVYGTDSRYENGGSLRTRGFELSLQYEQFADKLLRWTPSLIISSYKTVLQEFDEEISFRGFVGPGCGCFGVNRIAESEELGQIWGTVFSGVDADGQPIFKDLNGDGLVITDAGSALQDRGDFQQLGQAIPALELGFNNTFTYKNWDFNAFFRGAFGHSLVNTFRINYEPISPGSIASYNRVVTDLAPEGLEVARFSSLYVEKADFIKLDNITLGYSFDFNGSTAFERIRTFISVQNAFVITNYTGLDPDPVLQDISESQNGFVNQYFANDPLTMGIDRRNTPYSARTYTFGINVEF
ncbi:MAG: SusC/RagA family TonB-linked outer membrane protein [Bacteroidia bacterium]|nr:SusC/RagA family TonB-linked outer membrane protein [Bacteroidia bacterium]